MPASTNFICKIQNENFMPEEIHFAYFKTLHDLRSSEGEDDLKTWSRKISEAIPGGKNFESCLGNIIIHIFVIFVIVEEILLSVNPPQWVFFQEDPVQLCQGFWFAFGVLHYPARF